MTTISQIIRNDDPQNVALAQRLGLIRPNNDGPFCDKRYCNQQPMRMVRDASAIDGFRWRCHGMICEPRQRRKRCMYLRSIRTHTFFAHSKLPIWKILVFVYQWCSKDSLKRIATLAEIDKCTAVDWASHCLQVVIDAMILNGQPLGGPGRTVEIYESKFGNRKYHRGCHAEGSWVFGGIELETGKVFVIPVACRSSAYLIPIIRHWILPGTTVISDYNCLQLEGFQDLTLNHSITFKDPVTGAHTNALKSTRRQAKESTSSHRQKSFFFGNNLERNIFWKACEIEGVDVFSAFCKVAGTIYNGIAGNIGRLTPLMEDYYRLLEGFEVVTTELPEGDESDEEGDSNDTDTDDSDV